MNDDVSWASDPGVRVRMQANRSRDTRTERRLRRSLYHEGLRFRVNYRPPIPCRCSVDVAIVWARVAIFVDGCFWHGCPHHYRTPQSHTDYWRDKIARNRTRDLAVEQALSAEGWAVVRIWEHEPVADATVRVVELIRVRARSMAEPLASVN